jgi:ParB/RepB/Spo0J family partition protein
MPQLSLNLLSPDPRNPNVCSEETLLKLKTNIQRTNLCPPLIVRPHPTKKESYILIDGHHRKLILEELGWKKAPCVIWDISDQEACLALATLNRLRGTDIPVKRAELLKSLSETLPLWSLAELIPETEGQIQDLLKLIQLDTEAMASQLRAEIEKEKEALPIPYTFLILPKDKPLIDQAFKTFSSGQTDRAQVFIQICTQALELKDGKQSRRRKSN